MPEELPSHARENRRHWNAMAHEWVEAGERHWAMEEPVWGIWGVPERELNLLPASMDGMRAIELGCGTGYVSAWMRRRGARVTGIDLSASQLETARRLSEAHGLEIEWVEGSAERTPFADEGFDFAISEYGAAIWCDPRIWIPEAWRLLRPGGRLVFLGHHAWAQVCTPSDGGPVGNRLEHSYFDLHRMDWTSAAEDPGGVEFALPISGWMALIRETGFLVENYLEPRPKEGVPESAFGIASAWARRFPSEQVWKLRKPGGRADLPTSP